MRKRIPRTRIPIVFLENTTIAQFLRLYPYLKGRKNELEQLKSQQKKHSPNTGEKCKCRNTKSPIATIRFWNANCPIHTESEVKKTKPSQQEMCKKCGHHGLRHSDGKKHACHIIDCKCKSFQPPKSSEWEDEIDSCISSIVGSQSEVEIMDAANHIKDKVKDLLSQQQNEVEERVRRVSNQEIEIAKRIVNTVKAHDTKIINKGYIQGIEFVLTSIKEKGGKG